MRCSGVTTRGDTGEVQEKFIIHIVLKRERESSHTTKRGFHRE